MSPSASVVHEVLPVVVLLLPVHGSRQPDKLQPCRGPGRRPAPDGQPGPVPRPPVLSHRHRHQPPGKKRYEVGCPCRLLEKEECLYANCRVI